MAIKYAYIHPTTREYLFVESREALIAILAELAAQTYIDHYCNGMAYTIVETAEDGAEKWYAPTGEQVMTPVEIEARIRHMQSFINAGEIPMSILGGSNAN
jgi:hypothetical protein